MPMTKAEQIERRGPTVDTDFQTSAQQHVVGQDRRNLTNTEWKRIPAGKLERWQRAHTQTGGKSFLK